MRCQRCGKYIGDGEWAPFELMYLLKITELDLRVARDAGHYYICENCYREFLKWMKEPRRKREVSRHG